MDMNIYKNIGIFSIMHMIELITECLLLSEYTATSNAHVS